MTDDDWIILGICSTLFLAALVFGTLYLQERRRTAYLRERLDAAESQKGQAIDLLAAAALAKGGTLKIPTRGPGWSAPGIEIERRPGQIHVTVQGGPHG